jgi:hypothetical protein
VSILNRSAAHRHLTDRVLAEIWSVAASDGRPADHPHLAACADCRARLAAFASWMNGLRRDAHDEADAAFPPERLAAQQQAISRRLEALERPARVIAFPRATRPVTGTHHVTRRWIATAAAAGLVIGLAAGQLLDLKQALEGPTVPPAANQTAALPARSPIQPAASNTAMDEALFYGDADATARSARYMPALDELTPRARDEFERNR